MFPSLQLLLAPTPSAAQMGMCWESRKSQGQRVEGGPWSWEGSAHGSSGIPKAVTDPGLCGGGGDVRRVGFLPRLFWGWNIPNGAGAAGGGLGAGRDPGRGNPGPPKSGRGWWAVPPRPTCFTTHTAPLKIWQTGNKWALAPSVL